MKKLPLITAGIIITLNFTSCTPGKTDNPDSQQKTGLLSPFENGHWVDLSHAYDKNTIYWPTEDGFKLDTSFVGETDGGYYYSAFSFKTAEHGGTHMDAPVHFAEGAHSVDQVPLSQLTGNFVVVDVSERALKNRDYQISVKDIESWESDNGKLEEGVIILFKTGYGQYWPNRKEYLGTDMYGPKAVAELHFPGIAPELSKWLIENRNIKAVGLDTPSIDYGQSKDFLTHRILFKENIAAFENVANLDKLPVKGGYLVALPMKIKHGSGAPIRIAAFVPD